MNDDDIDDMIRNALNDGETDLALSKRTGVPITSIRRRESITMMFLGRFPKAARMIPYKAIQDMMVVRELPITTIADILKVNHHTVESAISIYGITVSDDARKRIRRKAYDVARRKTQSILDDPRRKDEIMRRRRATCMDRYGVPSPIQSPDVKRKIDDTLKDRYGRGGSPFSNESIREKAKDTMMDRYGAKHSWQSEEVKESIRRTNLDRYGVENPMQSDAIREKARRTNLERYGVEWNTLSESARAKAIESYERHYGVDNPSKSPIILDRITKSMNKGPSSNELMVSRLLDSIGIDYLSNDHDIIGQELDFVIPSRRLAIEVSPVFTHHSNENQVMTVPPKPMGYHKHKHDEAERHGYELITLSDPYLTKDRWSTMTAPFIRMKATGTANRVLYARNTSISPVSGDHGRRECMAFIDRNHFKGNTPAMEYYAIRDHDGVMIGAFSLRHRRGLPDDCIELARMAWESCTQVRYGLSKVVHDISRRHPDIHTLLSFSDNDMGNGLSYDAAGFDYDGDTPPSLHFINPHDPMDSYSWQVATPWGARNGIISRLIHPMSITKKEAKLIVETRLPHRSDNGHGYFSYYDTGSKRWLFDLTGIR